MVLRDAGTKTATTGVVPGLRRVPFNTPATFYWQARTPAMRTTPARCRAPASRASWSSARTHPRSRRRCRSRAARSVTRSTTRPRSPVQLRLRVERSSPAWYSSLSDCQAGTVGTPGGNSAGDKTVTNHIVPPSDGVQFNSAGTFYWRAFYTGDANNNSASSVCQDETLVIAPNSPSIATTLSKSSGKVGDTINDTSALAGATATAGRRRGPLVLVSGFLPGRHRQPRWQQRR